MKKLLLFFFLIPTVAFAQNIGDGGRIGGGEFILGFQDEASSDVIRARKVVVDTGSLEDNTAVDGSIHLHFASSDLVENTFVPYSGATKEVDLGSQDIKTTGTATSDVVDTHYIEYSSGGPVEFRDNIALSITEVPTGPSASGIAGEIAWDGDYIYICTAPDTWERVTIASWAVTDRLLLDDGTSHLLLDDGTSKLLIR